MRLDNLDSFNGCGYINARDPYYMRLKISWLLNICNLMVCRNHLGTYECKLCLTLHNNEASYLAHTQACDNDDYKMTYNGDDEPLMAEFTITMTK